jgi:phage terminase large subunit-like protein
MTAILESPPCSLSCQPRWATVRRSAERPQTRGERVALVARRLGTPLMWWQQYVADVAGEVDPETGQLAYREVVLTVPRQSGKTTLILAEAVDRALGFGGRQNIVYTAQTRVDAKRKWEDDHLPILKESAFGSLFRPRKAPGNEAFVWTNGSIHGLAAPTKKSGHGPTLDLGFMDEAFAHTDDRLEQAFRPAMITRPQPQLWIVSTAGTAESVYLRAKVAAGRSRLDSGVSTTTAYFEWSATEDADPLEPGTWWTCMPALGNTVSEAAIRAELDSMLAEHGPDGLQLFRRAYMNQWTDERPQAWLVIPRMSWMARLAAPVRPDGQVALALDAAWPDAESASIAVAGRRNGEMVVQIVDHRPGTSWLVERVVELRDRHKPAAIVLDPASPVGREKAALEAAGVELNLPTLRDVTQAAGSLYTAVMGDVPYLRHFDQPELNAAVAAAQKRSLGDAWTWTRKGTVDISPLVAATLAAWGHASFARSGPPADIF